MARAAPRAEGGAPAGGEGWGAAAGPHAGVAGRGGTDRGVDTLDSTDAVWTRNADGTWILRRSLAGGVVKTDLLKDVETLALADGDVTIAVGQAPLAPARDFDGGGNNDYLFRAADGSVAIWHGDGTTFAGGGNLGNPGAAWKVAGIDDFNDDSLSDLLWRKDGGAIAVWYMDGVSGLGGGFVANPGTLWHPV